MPIRNYWIIFTNIIPKYKMTAYSRLDYVGVFFINAVCGYRKGDLLTILRISRHVDKMHYPVFTW